MTLVGAVRRPTTLGVRTPRSERRALLASWCFIGPYFIINVAYGNTGVDLKTNLVGTIGVLLMSMSVIAQGRCRVRDAARVAGVFYGLAIATIVYVARAGGAEYGTASGYIVRAVLYTVVAVSAIAYACLFFEEERFVDVYWRLCRIALGVAFVGYAVSTVTGFPVLTHSEYGYSRLKGLLSEPSAWAPVIASMALLALNRRSWRWLALVLAAAWLVNSPIVLATVLVSIPLYYSITSRWSGQRPAVVLAIAGLLPPGAYVVSNADSAAYLRSDRPIDQTVGRMLAGIENVRTGGEEGSNTRYKSSEIALDELRANGAMYEGLGPGAADEYFPARFGDDNGVRPNSLLMDTMFNFGVVGAAALALLLVVSMARMRRSGASSILVPFVVASLINSAGGANLYKFAVLAVAVFGLGWGRTRPSSADEFLSRAQAKPVGVSQARPW